MNLKQWERLLDSLEFTADSNYVFKTIVEGKRPKLRATRVKDKGAIVTLVGLWHGKPVIEYWENHTDRTSHEKLDLVDADGRVIEEAVRDMLGEPLEAGAWVTYPFGYRDNHSMGIGRIVEIKSGVLKVEAKVENAEPIDVDGTGGHILSVRSEKCVKLPVDVPRMMMAILTNFQSIDGRHD